MPGMGWLTSESEIANINGAPGDFYWNMGAYAAGSTVVLGWKRLTQSNAERTNNTLNVDYVEVRVTTSG